MKSVSISTWEVPVGGLKHCEFHDYYLFTVLEISLLPELLLFLSLKIGDIHFSRKLEDVVFPALYVIFSKNSQVVTYLLDVPIFYVLYLHNVHIWSD